jgi:CspA family cold shock protein
MIPPIRCKVKIAAQRELEIRLAFRPISTSRRMVSDRVGVSPAYRSIAPPERNMLSQRGVSISVAGSLNPGALLSMKLAKLYEKEKINISTGWQFLLIAETCVAMGTVKWFNPTKGYGFIQLDDGGNDVFVHISAVEKAGLSTLGEGARVSYEVFAGRGGKTSAEKRRLTSSFRPALFRRQPNQDQAAALVKPPHRPRPGRRVLDLAFRSGVLELRSVQPAGKIGRPTAVRTFFEGRGEYWPYENLRACRPNA